MDKVNRKSHGMNILILSNIEGTGNYPVYIAKELSKLGSNVRFLATGNDNPSWLFRTRYRRWRHLGRWGKLIINTQVHSAISSDSIDILLIFSNNFLHPTALRLIKKRGVKIVLWEGNLAFKQRFQREAIPWYDLIIVGDTYIIPFLRDVLGHRNSHYLKGNGVPSKFYPVTISQEQHMEYGADVSFVGKWFPNREAFFGGLELPVRIWGNGWHKSSWPVAKRNQIRYLDPSRKRLVFCGSKINLNLRAGPQQANNFSTRIYEVPLCGGFVMSEWTKDLVESFQEDKEIVTFRSPEEAQGKIDYFLERKDERHEITARLREKIMKKHLLKDTVARVNELMQKL